MSCCQIASLRFCHGYTPWFRWQTPRGVSTRSRLLSQPPQTGSNSEVKSAAVAASRDEAAGGWSSPWSAAILASVSLVKGQAAAITAFKWHGAGPPESQGVWGRSPPECRGSGRRSPQE